MANYYLIYYDYKKNRNKAKTLIVPNNTEGVLYRNFKDISDIDLYTMTQSKDNIFKELSKYNKDLDIKGTLYIAAASKNNTSFYPVIYDDKKFRYYTAFLLDFAEERSNKVKVKKELKQGTIDLDNGRALNEYGGDILYSILSKPECEITDYESILPVNLKNIMKERYSTYYNTPTDKYMYYWRKTYMEFLKHYLNLRALTITYIEHLKADGVRMRSRLRCLKDIYIEDLMPIEPINIKKIDESLVPEQMQLAQFNNGTDNIPYVLPYAKKKTRKNN